MIQLHLNLAWWEVHGLCVASETRAVVKGAQLRMGERKGDQGTRPQLLQEIYEHEYVPCVQV